MAADGLRLAEDLLLPLDTVTETLAYLGKRGSGKTSTAVVLCEEMIQAGLPVVIVDPIGVWWGLRSSADGTGDGLPVVIFGGEHADLPLPEHAGARLADLIIDHRPPAVLDLSDLSKSAARRFVADFLERLYHRNRDPLHVVLDEADLWAPQRTAVEGARLLGAVQDGVRRGRARGLGFSLITQRPAVLNKDVLGQAEVLIALRMTGVRDVAAIDDWVRLHAEDDEAAQVKASLPSLPVGTAWVWSPGWLGILRQCPIRRRATFDSSATPKVGERRVMPGRMAPVDLAALRDELAEPDADQERPDTANAERLLRRVAELERQHADASNRAPEVVEVPAVTPELVEQLQAAVAAMTDAARSVTGVAERITTALSTARPRPERSTVVPIRRDKTSPQLTTEAVPLKAGARRMLDTLGAHYPMRVTRAQLATLTRMKVTGGTFGTYYSVLRRNGLIDEHDGLTGLTDAGQAATSAVGEPATTEKLVEQWRSALKAGARTMLDLLIAAHPAALTRAELAEGAGLEMTGGTFSTYLGILRRNGLADVVGDQVRASATLFLSEATP